MNVCRPLHKIPPGQENVYSFWNEMIDLPVWFGTKKRTENIMSQDHRTVYNQIDVFFTLTWQKERHM